MHANNLPQHPTGVQPLGNRLLKGGADCRAGLGYLRCLEDQLMLQVLGNLPAPALLTLSQVCRALYCFANHEELWRAMVLEKFEGRFTYKGTWRLTYLSLVAQAQTPGASFPRPTLTVSNFYSDLLYQPFHCASLPISNAWLAQSNIDRQAGLSLHQFREEYELRNQPVVITDVVKHWPAFQKWNRKYLQARFAKREVTVGDYQMRFKDFLQYLDSNADEMPLYLFDKQFAAKAPSLAEDFQVPEYFAEDLFSLLTEERRPDYRWLIMGCKRSGSSFHKDPNSTSAWNAVITGSKKWILYPPNVLPPGVFASDDGSDVASPVSLMEWFLNFYEESQASRVKPRECVVNAGELLFVPRGWWHLALNLEESIAVTQNYVSSANLSHVLKFLATNSQELISGCPLSDRKTLHSRFLTALQKQDPKEWNPGNACDPECMRQLQHKAKLQYDKGQRACKPILEIVQFSDSIRPSGPKASSGGTKKALTELFTKQEQANSAAAAFTFGF